jgi:hypothetical protein
MNTIVVAVLKSSVIRNTRPARFDRSPVTDKRTRCLKSDWLVEGGLLRVNATLDGEEV